MTIKVCPQGHEYTPGETGCVTCRRDRSLETSRLITEAAAKLGMTRKEYKAKYGQGVRAAKQVLYGEVPDPYKDSAQARIEDVEWLAAHGCDLAEAAERTYFARPDGLSAYLRRHDRADLIEKLTAVRQRPPAVGRIV